MAILQLILKDVSLNPPLFPDGSLLPEFYARWMKDLLPGPIPEETEATCHDCPICSADPARNKSEFRFDAKTKCCTYMPEIPNFLAGAILSDSSPEFSGGRDAFIAALQHGAVASPLGVHPPSAYAALYKKSTDDSTFGRNPYLRCPYYLTGKGGTCGIWRYRNSRCATWFCKFVRGSSGVIFWKYLDQLLTSVENALAVWCVLQLDLNATALQYLFPPPSTERSEEYVKQMWGSWLGREPEFFQRCWALAGSLKWNEMVSIGGAQVGLIARQTLDAYGKLFSEEIPGSLKVGAWKKVSPAGQGTYRIWTYNRYDPIDIPQTVFDVLFYFDGRPTQQSLAVLQKERNLEWTPAFLRKLVDFGVLVAS